MAASAFVLAMQLVAPAHAEDPATTQPDTSTVITKGADRIYVEAQRVGSGGGTNRPRDARGRRPTEVPTVHHYWSLEWLPGDSFCLRRRSTTNAAVAAGAASDRWYSDFARANGATQRVECPTTPRPERTPARAADDPARRFWDVRVLPGPVLTVVPDYAPTGKPVYLQIAGPQDQSFSVDNPIGADVAISARSRYVMDWGDGTTTATSSQGGPWPGGDVTHTYTDMAPAVTITVTQLWEATWRAGSASGDLRDLRTAATLTLPVRQLQAVRNV